MQSSTRLSSSAAVFRKVIVGVSTATTRSCYRTSRGKAHAVPLPAQEPPQKPQKRIPLQKRRAKIMEFVENYRASNDGKFPTMRNTRQQVRGRHYTLDFKKQLKSLSGPGLRMKPEWLKIKEY
ncbi:hypothetical protein U9M48_027541 [Paspalum notatum var. saurae]|uniref:AT3G52170-like helix-turn-helix domain-containing protein n=1 Tax=Paspalum notatum var. saurae TaxID=547442 RepID=A0AAQ3WZJ1_PASNO